MANTSAWPGSPGGSASSAQNTYDRLVETATDAAVQAGRGAAVGRRWLEEEAIGKRPVATLLTTFALGVITGWIVKRRS